MHRHQISVRTNGKGLVDITKELEQWIGDIAVDDAMLHVYLQHTSASLLINEGADPRVGEDLENWMAREVVDGDALFTHREEGEDDMSAHVRVALTAVEATIPILHGRLGLGRWQRVFLWEHRHGPMERRLILSAWD